MGDGQMSLGGKQGKPYPNSGNGADDAKHMKHTNAFTWKKKQAGKNTSHKILLTNLSNCWQNYATN